MINPSEISTIKTPLTYTYHNHPPLPQKSPKVNDSGIYHNNTKNICMPKGLKLDKKYSYESAIGFDEEKKLGGSCKIIPREKTVPKSHSTNLISSKVESIQKNRRWKIKINKTMIEKEIKLYEWRSSTHFPIMKVGMNYEKSENLLKKVDSNGEVEVEVFIPWEEDVKYKLVDIDSLNLINSLYILQESLVAFERLYNKFGHFEPHIDMIFITNLMKCKLWLNANIFLNHSESEQHMNKKVYVKVEVFYQKVIKMLDEYFTYFFNNNMQEQTKRNVNLIEKLLYELGRKQDFIEALKLIKEFAAVYTLKVNSRYLDITDMNSYRSKISMKKDNTNRSSLKMKTLPVFSTNQQVEIENDNKLRMINSLESDYMEMDNVINNTNRSKQNQDELNEEENEQIVELDYGHEKINKESSFINQKEELHIRTKKNSTNKERLPEVTQSNCKTIIMNKRTPVHPRDNNSFKRQSQVSICSKQTIVEKKNRFSMHEDINNEEKFERVKDVLPNFTNEDFLEAEDDESYNMIENENDENEKSNERSKIGMSRQQQAADEDEYEEKVRNEIEKNVRERNGWLMNPMFLLEIDDCAKSFQDSQPSIKAKIRERNLSKLNRIKSSIANSIVE